MRRSFSAESAPFAGGADPFMISSLLTSYYREVWGDMMTLLEDCQNLLQLITCVSNTWTVQFCARNVYTFLRQKVFHPHSDNRAFFSYRWEWRRRFLKGKEIGFTALQNEENISNAKCSLNSSSHSFI